jgi:hypothetical protein
MVNCRIAVAPTSLMCVWRVLGPGTTFPSYSLVLRSDDPISYGTGSDSDRPHLAQTVLLIIG